MTAPSRSISDAILDALGDKGIESLLQRLPAPDNGAQSVTLLDLATGRSASLGEDGAAARGEDVSLAQRWLGGSTRPPGRDEGGHVCLRVDGSLVILLRNPAGIGAGPATSRLDLPRLRAMCGALASTLADAPAQDAPPNGLMRVWGFDKDSGVLGRSQSRPGTTLPPRVRSLEKKEGLRKLLAMWLGQPSPGAPCAELDAVALDLPDGLVEIVRVPFVPRLCLVLTILPISGNRVWDIADGLATEVLREIIRQVLDGGFETQLEPFPQTDIEFESILRDLRSLSPRDLDQRLRLAGFADHPIDGADGSMRCQECIYYLPHRRWCDLPELPVPVEPDWYCRLWKL